MRKRRRGLKPRPREKRKRRRKSWRNNAKMKRKGRVTVHDDSSKEKK